MKSTAAKLIPVLIMTLIAVLLVPFTGLSESDSEALDQEQWILANAQKLYDSIIKEHGSASGYVNYIAQQQRYYSVTLNEADYYNLAHKETISFTKSLAKIGISVITKSPSKALQSIGNSYYNLFLKEVFKELPKVSTTSFVFGQAADGLDQVGTSEMWDIMDRVADNGGKFTDLSDAVNFIVDYQNNKAGFVSAELGRAYYMDQLNQTPWDTLGEVAKNIAVSEISKQFCEGDWFLESSYIKGHAVTQLVNYLELVVAQYDNQHLVEWAYQLERIERETEKLLFNSGDSGSGGSTVSTLPSHTVYYNANGGNLGVSRYVVYEGTSYGYMPVPFRFGYDFEGWYNAAVGGKQYSAENIYPFKEDQTLYAHWTRTVLESGSCGENLTYTLYGDGLLEINGYGEMTSAPWTHKADRIGEVRFQGKVTTLCSRAFSGCEYLHDIDLPSTIKVIENEAFAHSGLQRLSLPEGTETLGTRILEGAEGVKDIVVPGSIKEMEYSNSQSVGDFGVFTNSSVQRIVLGNGIEEIAPFLCYRCESLSEVELPSSLRTIGERAFSGTGIKELILPHGVVNLGFCMAENTNSLESVFIPNTIQKSSEPFFLSSLTSVTFEKGMDKIPDKMFVACHNLERIDIPDTVHEIGSYAFEACGLTELNLPSNLEVLGVGILDGTPGVKSIDIPPTVKSMHYDSGANRGVFYNSSLEEVIFESGVECIGNCAFMNCETLKSVKIPDSVTTIQDYAFYRCTALREVSISKSVVMISSVAFSAWLMDDFKMFGYHGSYAEEYCRQNNITFVCLDELQDAGIILPSGVTTIEAEAFEGCGFEAVTIQEGTLRIDEKAFAYCSSLRQVVIPESVKQIANSAFEGDDDLIVFVVEGSYAEEFAKSHEISVAYANK